MVVQRGGKLVPLDRHPLVVFLMAWAAFRGLAGVWAVVSDRPNPPGGQMPWWLDLLWYSLLGVGGLAVLVGTFWRRPIEGVLIVRAGYWPLGSGGLAYAAALSAAGSHASAVIIAAFSVACVWRALSIRREAAAGLAASL